MSFSTIMYFISIVFQISGASVVALNYFIMNSHKAITDIESAADMNGGIAETNSVVEISDVEKKYCSRNRNVASFTLITLGYLFSIFSHSPNHLAEQCACCILSIIVSAMLGVIVWKSCDLFAQSIAKKICHQENITK